VATTDIDRLAQLLRHATAGVAVLTGAGVSVASGVPSFRGTGGIWERHDPMEVATLTALRRDPARVWRFFDELEDVLTTASPNAAHHALASLEDGGFVQTVITQNIDGLHQAAGSIAVIELHGSPVTLTCTSCRRTSGRTPPPARDDAGVPRCAACDGVLKPDITLFGESLPGTALRRAEHAVRRSGVLLVVGTSAEVEPAARLPRLARTLGATVVEVNPEPVLAGADSIAAPAEVVLPELARRLQPTVLDTVRALFGRRR
jgi:NAD-dependent deacetylase